LHGTPAEEAKTAWKVMQEVDKGFFVFRKLSFTLV
jgi:hypothetical protein